MRGIKAGRDGARGRSRILRDWKGPPPGQPLGGPISFHQLMYKCYSLEIINVYPMSYGGETGSIRLIEGEDAGMLLIPGKPGLLMSPRRLSADSNNKVVHNSFFVFSLFGESAR